MKEEWVWGGESFDRVSGSLEDEAMSFGGSSWSRWSQMNEADLHHMIIHNTTCVRVCFCERKRIIESNKNRICRALCVYMREIPVGLIIST